MKKILFLYFLIFLSCDPGWFGLDETDPVYSYHDAMALGWEVFFRDNDYDTAISYFHSAITNTEDEEYYNSAHIALGWLYLFKSNSFVNTVNPDSIGIYRDSAFVRLSYEDNEDLAIIGYDTGCYYDFCCSDCFVEDRQLGVLYNQIEAFFILSEEEQETILADDAAYIQNLTNSLSSFTDTYTTYDFMNGKPMGNTGETMDLNTTDIQVYLATVYFRMGLFTECCEELDSLEDYQDCELNCTPDADVWDHNNLDDLLECLNTQRLF